MDNDTISMCWKGPFRSNYAFQIPKIGASITAPVRYKDFNGFSGRSAAEPVVVRISQHFSIGM